MKVTRDNLSAFAAALRAHGQRIVFTNGCFDILHVGHVRYLGAARALGDCLVVGLNSDASVRRLKGPERPVNEEADRAEVLDALRAVDYVTIFDEPTAAELIEIIRPDVYVKGGDYTIATLPEAEIVRGYGGRVEFIDLVPERSTTRVIEKLRGTAL
ncbi:MAG: D-glycero-beta-D-manno-heptose 1-phosphate adenylyltransferase [Negativicutes bacterium]